MHSRAFTKFKYLQVIKFHLSLTLIFNLFQRCTSAIKKKKSYFHFMKNTHIEQCIFPLEIKSILQEEITQILTFDVVLICVSQQVSTILEGRDRPCSDFSLNQGFCVPSRRLGSAGAGQPLMEKTPQGGPVRPPLQVHRASFFAFDLANYSTHRGSG